MFTFLFNEVSLLWTFTKAKKSLSFNGRFIGEVKNWPKELQKIINERKIVLYVY